ncbi:MAG: sigma-54 dependent transcriptional regulator [Planctomycetia bacterium]|nr:sigma-54 dependent transcriptional regulator [Planctomycetia bacterium]
MEDHHAKHRILVVEDGPGEREALARVLKLEGYEVLTAHNPDHALTLLDEPVSLVVTDLKMGARNGLDLMRTWRGRRPSTPFIVVTAYGDVDSAVSAMKLGATDFLTKPIDPPKLLDLIRECLLAEAADKSSSTARAVDVAHGVERLIGVSTGIERVRQQVRRVAPSDSIVLIVGEPGTGKELVAEALHAHSTRAAKPFVVIDLAAVPEALIDSELFGHVQGAFHGATADRIGRFEAADGGTLFIDEVGGFPLPSQAKLLRALETQIVQRVGSSEDRMVNARLIAASSNNLRKMVQEKRFREELFQRLNVVTIEMPPLRERREDIPLLVHHLASRFASGIQKPLPKLTAELHGFLISYDWPGNVRELRNCLESMIVLSASQELTLHDLPANIAGIRPEGAVAEPADESSAADDLQLSRLEKSVILQTLKRMEGNRTRAAEALGISVRTLQRRLKGWTGEV